MGCGEEDIPNSGKTPGWKISSNDVIEKDGRGFKKLLLRRNHKDSSKFVILFAILASKL